MKSGSTSIVHNFSAIQPGSKLLCSLKIISITNGKVEYGLTVEEGAFIQLFGSGDESLEIAERARTQFLRGSTKPSDETFKTHEFDDVKIGETFHVFAPPRKRSVPGKLRLIDSLTPRMKKFLLQEKTSASLASLQQSSSPSEDWKNQSTKPSQGKNRDRTPEQPQSAYLSVHELILALEVPSECKRAVEVFIYRFGKRYKGCVQELPKPRKGDPRQVYQVDAIWDALIKKRLKWIGRSLKTI